MKFLGADASRLERDEYYGSVTFRSDGVELVLKEAPWVLPAAKVTDPKALYVSGFHFHREGHEGFAGYAGTFHGGIAFTDSETQVRRKLGQPLNSGGGGLSRLLKKPIPRWLCYGIDGALLNLQFDADGELEMVTLFLEQPARE